MSSQESSPSGDQAAKEREAEAARQFASLIAMCAHAGTDPGAAAGLNEYQMQRLAQNPYLRQGWEIALSAAAEPRGRGPLNRLMTTFRSFWQRRNRDRVVDKVAKQFAAATNAGCCWVTISVGGQTENIVTSEGTRQIHHPLEDSFLVRTLGLPAETVREFATALGRGFGRSQVQLKAFGRDGPEAVDTSR